MYRKADFTNDETRDCIFEYFIDKIFVYEDKHVIDLFTSDDRTEIDMDIFWNNYEYAVDSVRTDFNQVHECGIPCHLKYVSFSEKIGDACKI